MAYRHVKNVLGETNLERKCRLLFGACISLLVAATFIWVWRQTKSLVYEKDSITGSLLVDAIMLKVHWDSFEENRVTESVVNEMTQDLQYRKYKWEVLSLEPSSRTTVPTDAWE